MPGSRPVLVLGGISADEAEETLCPRSHLPLFCRECSGTVLTGLGSITEAQVRQIRCWLVDTLARLGLATGRATAFDIHQIDQDVLLPELRQIGKGTSPKKKVCHTEFRPQIAWDIDSGALLVAEFRGALIAATWTYTSSSCPSVAPCTT